MKAMVMGRKVNTSKYGGKFYYVFFKDNEGKSYRTCIHDKCRNFNKWKSVVESNSNPILDNLNVIKETLVDADSNFTIIGNCGVLAENARSKNVVCGKGNHFLKGQKSKAGSNPASY